MRIAVITNYWKNSQGGGVKTYLINLVDEFKKRENVTVNVVFEKGEDPENCKIDSKLSFAFKSYFVLKKIKPNLILSQGTWYCLLAGYIYKSLHNSILIHTFHTEPESNLSFFGKLFMDFLLNRCDYVTFVSCGLENKIDEMWKLNFRSKRAITYAGVNPKEVSDNDINNFCEKFNLKNDQIVLLAQGLTQFCCKAEGAKILIKAIQILKNKYPEIVLVLTKEGRYSNELKELVRNESVQKHVIITGDIDNPYVPLKLCNIYTHITLCEGGLSIALLEAMVTGKPIIATPVGGIPEVLEDNINGLLVEPYPEMLAEKIDKLIENREFADKLGENAKKTVEERFTWKISADNFLKLT
jgi:glycosyltransferase involved in cell wall biosynthesis